jgi:hypothetical protein
MTALLTVTTKLAYFMGAGGILFIGASVWWLWRRRKKIKSSCQVQPIATGTEIEDVPIPDTGAPHPEIADFPTLLSEIAGSCGDSGTRSFMDEIITRIREEASEFDESTPLDIIEELVDRLDDLRLLRKKATPDEGRLIGRFIAALTDLLKAAGVELLHSDSWDPDIQRALAKTPTEGISKPEIASFGSTGISQHSKLIRKQEVLLAVPTKTNS